MVLNFSLNTIMMWMIFIRMLRNKTQIKTQNIDCIIVFDDINAHMLSN